METRSNRVLVHALSKIPSTVVVSTLAYASRVYYYNWTMQGKAVVVSEHSPSPSASMSTSSYGLPSL